MIYTELDLATEERNAWQRGDYAKAQALALALDAEQVQKDADDAIAATEAEKEQADDELRKAEQELSDLRANMEAELSDLRTMIENAARVSDREAILAKLDAINPWEG